MKSLAILLSLFVLAGCKKPAPSEPASEPEQQAESANHAEHNAHEHHGMHEPLPAAEPAGGSLYQLDVDLADENGEPVTWDDLRGEKVVIAMIYTSCTTACPLIISEIKTVREVAESDVRVLLVSMDPEKDDAAARKALFERHKFDERWQVAGATADDVRELAAALGVRYRRLPDGNFNHSQVITVLDAGGTAVGRAEGLGTQRGVLVDALAN